MPSPPPPDFELSQDLDAAIRSAAEMLRAARRPSALTGAGLSVESGIPPFRGPGGLWEKHGEPPMDGYQRFLEDPARAWAEKLNPSEEWLRALVDVLAAAKPNAGHFALAELERSGLLSGLITQNVDDLHQQAGSRVVLEIHGNLSLLRCLSCGGRFREVEVEIDPQQLPPNCPECGGLIKGDAVQFGETIPVDVMQSCTDLVEDCDCMLVVGTSATVYPAASFPIEVLRSGGRVIEVNPYESELTPVASLSLQGPAGTVLTRLLEYSRDAARESEHSQGQRNGGRRKTGPDREKAPTRPSGESP